MLSRHVNSPMCDAELRQQTSHLVDFAGFEIAVKGEHTDLLFRFLPNPSTRLNDKASGGKKDAQFGIMHAPKHPEGVR